MIGSARDVLRVKSARVVRRSHPEADVALFCSCVHIMHSLKRRNSCLLAAYSASPQLAGHTQSTETRCVDWGCYRCALLHSRSRVVWVYSGLHRLYRAATITSPASCCQTLSLNLSRAALVGCAFTSYLHAPTTEGAYVLPAHATNTHSNTQTRAHTHTHTHTHPTLAIY